LLDADYLAALRDALVRRCAGVDPRELASCVSERFREADLALLCECLADPVFRRLAAQHSNAAGRPPSLGLLLQHAGTSADALKRVFLFGKDKLEVAFLIYLHYSRQPDQSSALAAFRRWLERALRNLVEPRALSAEREHALVELYGCLYALLLATKTLVSDDPPPFWPFESWREF